MHLSSLLLLSSLALTATAAYGSSASRACLKLNHELPGTVSYPGSVRFIFTNTQYYDTGSIETATCTFAPRSAKDVSAAMKILTRTQTKFAVKSGGHMSGYNSITDGVLITTEKMKSMKWKSRDSVLSVGAGLEWGEVYVETEKKGRVVVGGRVASVGVSGLILGGGISFLSGQHGFACDNVKGFEIVLVSGKTVYASQNSHADLYKALRGGSSNFGIVTRFDLDTFPQVRGRGWGGFSTTVLPTQADQQKALGMVSDYNTNGATSDKNSGIVMAMVTTQGGTQLSVFQLWHSEPPADGSTPAVFQDAASLPGTYGPMPIGQFVSIVSAVAPKKGTARNHFVTGSLTATEEAVKKTHEIINAEFADVLLTPGLVFATAFQPITSNHVLTGSSRRGGNVFGLESRVTKAPFMWLELAVTWGSPADDEQVLAAQKRAMEKVMAWAHENNLADPFLYLNDCGPKFNQPAIASYGANNVAFLKQVKKRYDPKGVFTKLMPGGFKI